MKNICGIELKGNDAILIVLQNGNIVRTNKNKISLSDSKNQESIKAFHKEIIDFFATNNIDIAGIKERATKGRFAGGSASFKMEGLIQNTDCEVKLINGKTISAKLKGIDTGSYELLKYQEGVLQVALYLESN